MTKRRKQQDDDHIYEISNLAARSATAVIDTVCKRGGFNGEELLAVGQLREQCVQIVQICENYHSGQGTDDDHDNEPE